MSDCRFGVSPVNYPDPDYPERNCPVLSTCATRAGRGVGTMWLIGLFLNIYTDIVRTETAGLPIELFSQPVSHSIDK